MSFRLSDLPMPEIPTAPPAPMPGPSPISPPPGPGPEVPPISPPGPREMPTPIA